MLIILTGCNKKVTVLECDDTFNVKYVVYFDKKDEATKVEMITTYETEAQANERKEQFLNNFGDMDQYVTVEVDNNLYRLSTSDMPSMTGLLLSKTMNIGDVQSTFESRGYVCKIK